jgi:renalase
MAGLSAANYLAKEHEVTILDKGRGVGGRMATRTLGTAIADHGAQYFSVQSEAFRLFIDKLSVEKIVDTWQLPQRSNMRYFASKGMKMIPKKMAENRKVLLDEKVIRLNGNVAYTEAGNQYDFDKIIITIPIPQLTELLKNSEVILTETDEKVLESIEYEPCIALMAILKNPTSITGGGIMLENQPVAWIADNFQKGITLTPSVTIHASAEYSKQQLENNLTEVAKEMLQSVEKWIPTEQIESFQVHRWRYSLASKRYNKTFYQLNNTIYLAGDGFGIGNVEGAFLSGLNVAQVL